MYLYLYDRLLIATGSHTFVPPVKNLQQAKNVIGFRNVEDIDAIREAVTGREPKRHVLLLGSGLVGLDCATGLLELGVPLTLVEMARLPMHC